MMKRIFTLLTAVAFVTGICFAGGSSLKKEKPNLLIDDVNSVVTSSVKSGGTVMSPQKTSAISWVTIDSANNAFGWANTQVKPFAYDPATGVLAFIHRGQTAYGASGQLFYNTSTDGGATWKRVSELNAGIGNFGRYPSCAISNPTGSSSPANALFVWSAPYLVGGAAFGQMIYGVDSPLGGGAPAAFTDFGTDTTLSSQSTIWASDNSPWVYWSMPETPGEFFWGTSDYATVNRGIPTGWANANFFAWYQYIVGKSVNGVAYLGFAAVFSASEDTSEYNIGYAKSTDNGTTWSSWVRPTPGWKSLPGFGPKFGWLRRLGEWDMLVDKNSKVHFFGAVEDSVSLKQSIVEIYEGASGWAVNTIAPQLDNTTKVIYGGGASPLNQTGRSLSASISPDGSVMAAIWIDNSGVANDTLPDIWFSHRSISGSWSTPTNITQSPNDYDMLIHIAPVLKSEGSNQYTAFIGRSRGIPDAWNPNESGKSAYQSGKYTFTQLPTAVGDQPALPSTYALKQNYPNPFNPSTKISFAVPTKSDVTLSVYNILGQEVATLVNEVKEAGTYDVTFSSAKLTSGVYFYTMKAGQYTETKKMVLMK
jgi:hypothetical protein